VRPHPRRHTGSFQGESFIMTLASLLRSSGKLLPSGDATVTRRSCSLAREVGMIPFEKFTEQARAALARTQELVARLQHNALDTEHLLLVLLGQGEGLVAEAIRQRAFDRQAALKRLQEDLGRRPRSVQAGAQASGLYVTTRLRDTLNRALAL